jgi:hypothetical protein
MEKLTMNSEKSATSSCSSFLDLARISGNRDKNISSKGKP